MFRRAGLAAIVLVVLTSLGVGQDDGRFDASFNGAPVFTRKSTGNGIQHTATIGSNYFGTFRFRLNPKQSLIFNYGRAKNSQVFQSVDDFHVLTTISELSGGWVYNPFQKGKFEPFLLVGAAALRFSPNSTWVVFPDFGGQPNRVQVTLPTAKQTEAALLYGAGLDYHLPGRFALRFQYRGFYYGNPDFKVNTNSGGAVSFVTAGKGHMAEPSIGLVFRF